MRSGYAALMKNSCVHRQAAQLARRVTAEANGELREAIGRAYRHCFSREASTRELERAARVAEETSLENVCWVLLNATEFLYVR